MPSEFILGTPNIVSKRAKDIIKDLPMHITTTHIIKQTNAGIETIIQACHTLNYNQKQAALCMTLSQEEHEIFSQEDKENGKKIAHIYNISEQEQHAYLARTAARAKKNNSNHSSSKSANLYAKAGAGSSHTLICKKKTDDSYAKIIGFAKYSGPRKAAITSSIFACSNLFRKHTIDPQAINLFEVHELCATTTIAFERAFSINENKINISGGACVTGDLSSLSILENLINGMWNNQKSGLAVAVTSNIEGESIAIAIEVL